MATVGHHLSPFRWRVEETSKKSRALEVKGLRKLILGSMGLSGTMFSLAQLYLENCFCLPANCNSLRLKKKS